MENLRTAIIDIGSNTIRLVLYKYNRLEGLKEFGNIKTVARLRTYLQENGDMSEQGISLLAETLSSFKKILDDYQVSDIKATATAAIRQARNNQEIISRMENETGILIDLLTEEEEAYFGFVAVAHSMDTKSAVTIDIGGGSTEITLFNDKKLQKTISFPFGTVSLKEKFVSGEIISKEEKDLLQQYIRQQFEKLDWIRQLGIPVIGIGGSARNIAQIHQQLIDYPISGVHQYELKMDELVRLCDYLEKLTFEQLKQLDGLSSDRADIIGIALEVFKELMALVNARSFQISKKGLREGLIYKRVMQSNVSAFDKYNVFDAYAKRITFEYGRSEKEGAFLRSITEQFYRECCNLGFFQYSERHLELLKRAAQVFAIGEYIEQDSSNQHTFYLLANQSIAGMNHVERVKLALLASYKNKDYFRRFSAPFITWISREELKTLKDYGAMLKFIYALNVSKRNIVKSIKVEKVDEFIQVNVEAEHLPMAEIYQCERQKKHIERLFKKPVQIHFYKKGEK
ncbi:Ppx/GppA family phosphatase [Ureibacillus sinduriensis]|uniref:Exopolyphosphatase n=1 Tax=Ureibacillus sinduriensis BLB-1 = JCM 15800 TaxID=1384057 RepID=A0A0A3HTV2_9BACL|nr:Ppx/GppA family phosphatase [Ureibacillus sinduriensis]KGR73723.1 exopolyphosphatase [Ureibacillus sinduriensis BLB-1 = JCM 15800]